MRAIQFVLLDSMVGKDSNLRIERDFI